MRTPKFALLTLMMAGVGLAQAPARPAITGIAFVQVYSADAAASQGFYSGVLGYDHTGINGLGRYQVNEAQWIEVAAMPSPAPQDKVAAIAFTTRDAAKLEKYLQSRGVAIVEPLHSGSFGIHDPEGRLVMFVQQSPAHSPSSSPISPQAGSHRIIHTGFVVLDRNVEDKFYKDLLGFRPYWYGGRTDSALDYVSLQVPDGTDWVEYMLRPAPLTDPRQLGSDNHLSLGVAHIHDAIAAVKRNACMDAACKIDMTTHVGRNGATQFNLYDPDLTRVEYMEFDPVKEPCCSPYTGPHPKETEDR
jgi:catechol 2,3-dioxygenase-like lactoylglutathione lyase family enzyme